MIVRHLLFPCLLSCLIIHSNYLQGAVVSWIAQSPNNDLNNPANWSSNSLPSLGDDSVFNSSVYRIATNPTENSAPFAINNFIFPSSASIFNLNFNNQTLTFNGAGISGANTNPTITVRNIDNNIVLEDQVSFIGSSGNSGSAIFSISNSASISGAPPTTSIGIIDSHLHSTGAFTMAHGGRITASNTGVDDITSGNNNFISFVGGSQLQFDQSFTASNNVALSISNSGTFTGNNTVLGDRVGFVAGSQFLSSGAFQTGNNFTCTVQNTGNDSGSAVSYNYIGNINLPQLNLEGSATVGDNATITVSNNGINSASSAVGPNFIAYVLEQQVFVGNAFDAGNNLNLTVSNTGTDSSRGYGRYIVAKIDSSSGAGDQILLQQGGSIGNNAAITVTNSGTYNGTNSNGGSAVGSMNLAQMEVGDSGSIGSHNFLAGDYFNLTVSNTGIDSGIGVGGDTVGVVTTDQVAFYTPVTMGKQATITITGNGNFSGNASSEFCTIGSAAGSQFRCASTTVCDDYFTLTTRNVGINTGTGAGSNYIGQLSQGGQVVFEDSLTIGNTATINISNMGSNSSSTTSGNTVGSMRGTGEQFGVEGLFQAGNDLSLTITNSGFNNSTNSEGNYVGWINTSTLFKGCQVHLTLGGSVEDRASISLSNTGTFQGATSNNLVGVLSGQQFYSESDFSAGANFNLRVTNAGTNSVSGQNGNSVGTVGYCQAKFGGAFSVTSGGPQITITNRGTNNGDGDSNYIGVIHDSQIYLVDGPYTFDTGSNAIINLSNTGINTGTSISTPSNVGCVDSQAQFDGNFNAADGLRMTLTNQGIHSGPTTTNQVGYITNSQLYNSSVDPTFNAGSNASIQVVNSGSGNGNLVGYVGGQVYFTGNFIASDNLILNVENNGTGTVANNQINFGGDFAASNNLAMTATNSANATAGSQIVFGGGFTPGNCATISAINHSATTINGVNFTGATTGGDVLINLQNSNLNIATAGATDFTLSGLNGDALCTLNSSQNLIIGVVGSCVSSATFNGRIVEVGSVPLTLTKVGASAQTVSDIGFTGLTSIQGGSLAINGLVGGDITIASGAILKGTGTYNGITTISNGGAIYPGNSIGTMNLATLTLNPLSTTVIEINGTASSLLDVTGTATVDGALQIVQNVGAYPKQGTYLILSAGTIAGPGTFSSVNTVPGFTFSLESLGQDIYLNYTLAIPNNGLSGNSLIVSNYLNENAFPSAGYTALAGLTGQTLSQALESVSPARNGFAAFMASQIAFSLTDLVAAHTDELIFFRKEASQHEFLSSLTADAGDTVRLPKKSSNKLSFWASAFGQYAHQEASLQNPSFGFMSEGLLIGLDYLNRDAEVIGGSLGVAHTHYNEHADAGHGDINYFSLSVYGNTFFGNFYLSPALWGIFTANDNTRNISFPGFSAEATATINAFELIPHLELGYDTQFSWGELIPFTTADWAINFQNAYTEHGAYPYNARQKANSTSMVRSETGLKFCEKWQMDSGTFCLKQKISYVFEKPFGTGTVNTDFVGMPGLFTVRAVNQNMNLGAFGLNFLMVFGKENPIKLDLGYQGEFGSNYVSNELLFTISKGY